MQRSKSAANYAVFITINKETISEEKYTHPIPETFIEIKPEAHTGETDQPPTLERVTSEIELKPTPVITQQTVADDKNQQTSVQPNGQNGLDVSVTPNLCTQICISTLRSVGYYTLRIGGTIGTFATTMSGLYNVQQLFAKYGDMEEREFSIAAWSFNITASAVMAGLAWRGIQKGIYRYSQFETEINIMGSDVKDALSQSINAHKEIKKLKKNLTEKDEQIALLQTTVDGLTRRVNLLSKGSFLNQGVQKLPVPMSKKGKKLKGKKSPRHSRFFKADIDKEKSIEAAEPVSSITEPAKV